MLNDGFEKNNVVASLSARQPPLVKETLYDVDLYGSCSLVLAGLPTDKYGFRLAVERHEYFWEYKLIICSLENSQESFAEHLEHTSILFEVENESQEELDKEVIEFIDRLSISKTRLFIDVARTIAVKLEMENAKNEWEQISAWARENRNKLNKAHFELQQGPLA